MEGETQKMWEGSEETEGRTARGTKKKEWGKGRGGATLGDYQEGTGWGGDSERGGARGGGWISRLGKAFSVQQGAEDPA